MTPSEQFEKLGVLIQKHISSYLLLAEDHLWARQHQYRWVERDLNSRQNTLVRLFCLGKEVSRQDALGVLDVQLLDALIGCRLVTASKGDSLQCPRLILALKEGVPFFAEMSGNTDCYWGHDSVVLSRFIASRQGGGKQCLDLCGGSGFLGLKLLCGSAESVLCVEINPFAAAVARLNGALNGRANFSVENADCVSFCASLEGSFDAILMNPPFIPSLPDVGLALPADGGPDGLRLTRRVLPHALKRLNAKGSFFTLAMLPSISEPNLNAYLKDYLGLPPGYEVSAQILEEFEVSPESKFLIALSLDASKRSSALIFEEVLAAYVRHLGSVFGKRFCYAAIEIVSQGTQ